MLDPLRIPGVLAAVQRAWEGQPDLPLSTLFGILANRGIGWGADDEDLVRELEALARVHPGELPLIDGRVTARYLVHTESPAHRVLVDPWRIIVRRPGVTAQPGVWGYATVRRAFVGGPLVVTSADGIDHRLGVVSGISLLDDAPTSALPILDGVTRRDLGDAVYLLTLDDDSTVLLSHGLERFVAGRRSLDVEERSWESVVTARPGEPLVVQPPGGGPVVEYAAVREILLVEDSPVH